MKFNLAIAIDRILNALPFMDIFRIESADHGNITHSYDDGTHWFYDDHTLCSKITDNPNKNCWNPRPCPRCKGIPLLTGEDACLRHIEDVYSACCGHGGEYGFIAFNNGVIIWLPSIRLH